MTSCVSDRWANGLIGLLMQERQIPWPRSFGRRWGSEWCQKLYTWNHSEMKRWVPVEDGMNGGLHLPWAPIRTCWFNWCQSLYRSWNAKLAAECLIEVAYGTAAPVERQKLEAAWRTRRLSERIQRWKYRGHCQEMQWPAKYLKETEIDEPSSLAFQSLCAKAENLSTLWLQCGISVSAFLADGELPRHNAQAVLKLSTGFYRIRLFPGSRPTDSSGHKLVGKPTRQKRIHSMMIK